MEEVTWCLEGLHKMGGQSYICALYAIHVNSCPLRQDYPMGTPCTKVLSNTCSRLAGGR